MGEPEDVKKVKSKNLCNLLQVNKILVIIMYGAIACSMMSALKQGLGTHVAEYTVTLDWASITKQ